MCRVSFCQRHNSAGSAEQPGKPWSTCTAWLHRRNPQISSVQSAAIGCAVGVPVGCTCTSLSPFVTRQLSPVDPCSGMKTLCRYATTAITKQSCWGEVLSEIPWDNVSNVSKSLYFIRLFFYTCHPATITCISSTLASRALVKGHRRKTKFTVLSTAGPESHLRALSPPMRVKR